jgi:hypothetical protein
MRSVSAAHWQHSWRASDAWQLERSAGVAGYRRRPPRGGAAQSRTRRRADARPLAVAGSPQRSATLTPAELLIVRSHGLRPIATVSATCWLHYGWSWTRGHSEGWGTALRRLKREAYLAGANAILDVKRRTIPFAIDISMDFTLVGTAVHVEGLAPSDDPIVATVPALEFVKLLEADVVPTGTRKWISSPRPCITPANWR